MMIYYHVCNVLIYFLDAMQCFANNLSTVIKELFDCLEFAKFHYAILIFMTFYCFLLWFDNQ